MLISLEIFGKHIGDAYTDFIPDDVKEICRTQNGAIIKRPDSRGSRPVLRYSYDGNPDSFFEGYIKEDGKTFHLHEVSNRGSRRLSLPQFTELFQNLEDDLKLQGIEKITANVIRRLVPIAVLRYGFAYANNFGKVSDYLLPRRKLSRLTTGLVKNIS